MFFLICFCLFACLFVCLFLLLLIFFQQVLHTVHPGREKYEEMFSSLALIPLPVRAATRSGSRVFCPGK